MFLLLQNATATADVYMLYSGVSATGTKLLTVRAQNQRDEWAVPWMPGLAAWVEARRGEFVQVFPVVNKS